MSDPATTMRQDRVRQRAGRDDTVLAVCVTAIVLFLIVSFVLPIVSMLGKSTEGADGSFAGLANFIAYFSQPGLSRIFWNTLTVSLVATVLTVGLAAAFSLAMAQSMMAGKMLFRAIAMLPLLAPSLLPGIALVYLFGNQGLLRDMLLGYSLYGPIGIVIGEVFFAFPIAFLIISTSLISIDRRLFEAAETLRAGRLRVFLTVTFPAMRFGLTAAFCAVFTKVFTDFGVPAVVGGNYTVLATDLYQKVVGAFDFRTGSVVGVLLLIPAVLAFVAGQMAQRGYGQTLSGKSVVYTPQPGRLRSTICFLICAAIAAPILAIIAMAIFGSLFRMWPYNLGLSLESYRFGKFDPAGWSAYWNSLKLAFLTSTIGTCLIFFGAWLVQKFKRMRLLRSILGFLCMLPMATPGMVLGLGYIFFFNNAANPLNAIYGTLSILVLSTVVHLYTVPHLTAMTALRQLDPELEAVGASLRMSKFSTFLRVTLPVCLPTVLRMASFLFMNAMTTISAVLFLYNADTRIATVSILLLNDNGMLGPAAAMSVLVLLTSAAVITLQMLLLGGLIARTQRWRDSGGRT